MAETGWLCIGVFVLGVLSFICYVVWAGILSILGIRKGTTPAPKPGAVDDVDRVAREMAALFRANLIDATTYQKVMEGLQASRFKGAGAPMPPPLPVMPIQGSAPAVNAPLPEGGEVRAALPSVPVPANIAPATPPVVPNFPPPHVVIPKPPPKPRRSMSDVMAAFMHDSNIRWGELVGGMLIIGGSIALVVSFWSQIAHHSFLQFGLFTGVTTAMLGLGLYAEHRWKLPTTSRGILLIATLLVPLNFLAFAALSHGATPTVIETVIEVGAIGLFGYLVWRAAGVLMPYWPRLLVMGVVGPSASLVLIQRLGVRHLVGPNIALGAIPVLIYCAVNGVMLARAARWKHIREHAIEAMFALLGVATFATAAAVGLLVFRAASPWEMAHELSPLLSVAMTPAMAVGLLIWVRVQERKLARYRVAGTAIGIGAALVLVGAIGLAWPDPAYLLPMTVADFLILSAIAWLFRIPTMHWIALPCAMIGYLTAGAVLRGRVGWLSTPEAMFEVLIDAGGGAALVGWFVVCAVSAWAFRRTGRTGDAWVYRRIALIVGVISLTLVSRTAFDPARATATASLVYGFYAAVAFYAAIRVGWLASAWAGCLLVLAACVQAVLTRTQVQHPWTMGLLCGATALSIADVVLRLAPKARSALGGSLKWTASFAAAAAITILAPSATVNNAQVVGAEILWAAGLWLLIALAEGSEAVFIVSELAIAAGVAVSVVGRLALHAWFRQAAVPLLHPWTLEAIGVPLAAIPLAASIARIVLPARWALARWLNAPWSVDRALALGLAAGLTIFVVSGMFDAMRIEFAIRLAERTPADWASGVAAYGSWLVLAELVVTFTIWTARRVESWALLLVAGVILLGCPLVAMRWAELGSSASVLRWLLAGAGVAGSAALWSRLKVGRIGVALLGGRNASELRAILVGLCAAPVIAMSVYPAALTLDGRHVLGPVDGTFFAGLGNSASYSIPLMVVALTFLGNAVRERSGGWVAAATGVTNLTVTLGYALSVTTAGVVWSATNSLRLVQLNVLVLSGYAIGWIGVRHWMYRRRGEAVPKRPPEVLAGLVVLAVMVIAIPLIGEAGWLFLSPGYADSMTALSHPAGWLAVVSCVVAMALLYGGLSAGVVGVGGALLAMMVAFSAAHYDVSHWLAFHAMMATSLVAAGTVLGAGVLRALRESRAVLPLAADVQPAPPAEIPLTSPPTPIPPTVALEYRQNRRVDELETVIHPSRYGYISWIAAFSVWLVLWAMRATLSDPHRPWWSTGCALTLSMLWVAVAWWMRSGSMLYVGGLLPNLAATFWWFEKPWAGSHDAADLLCGNAVVLAMSGLAGLVLHVQVFRHFKHDRAPVVPRFHRFALNVVTIAMVLFGGTAVLSSFGFDVGVAAPLTALPALFAGAILALATAADEGGIALTQVYAIGLAAVAIVVQIAHPGVSRVEWAYQIGGCAFVTMTGLVYSLRSATRGFLSSVGLPTAVDDKHLDRVRYCTAIIAAVGVCLAVRVDFTVAELAPRLLAASAAMVQLLALGALSEETRLLPLRQFCCVLGVGAAVGWVWAWMSPGADPASRSAAALMAISAVMFAGKAVKVVLERIGKASIWAEGVLAAIPVSVAVWICAGLAVIVFESLATGRHEAVVLSGGWAIVTLIIFLSGATVSVMGALRTDATDALGIRPERRGIYVYAAEVILAVAFLHLRLAEPWLFKGFFVQYWPLIVMAIAFAGEALGEVMERKKLAVVSEPLTRTGVFLPIIPALAFSMVPSRVDYAGLLFVVGFFYAVMSAMRRSFVLGIAAALAANGGLWSLLGRYPDLRFLVHPQLWMIPAAVSVLVAAQLNQDRLTAIQMRALRYACLTVVYVSSTGDIFFNGVRDHPMLPLVLAVLSVAGVLIGIMFRVRPFLFLGTSFLGVAIVTMIHFASVNLHWTWLWYVAVIVLGAGMLTLFGLFEKKRTEMLAIVEGLKSWE